MKATIALFMLALAPGVAAEAIRMEAMGWVKDSEREVSRELGIGELSIRVTIFNDGDVPVSLPSLILSNVAVWNSERSPTLLLTYTPWRSVNGAKKEYPIVPSKEAFFPVEIKPGESAYVKMEGTASWQKDAGSNPKAVMLRTTGFLADRLGFTAIELKSDLRIVDQRKPAPRYTVSPTADSQWLKVDEGFQFLIPSDWKNKRAEGIDSHVGRYEGPSAFLEFDELFGLGYTVERSQKALDELSKKGADPRLLPTGEEIWRVDGRVAHFTFSKVDPRIFGKREYPNVANLFVPYEGKAGYLSVHLFYANEDFLPTVRRIFQSFEWPKKGPASR